MGMQSFSRLWYCVSTFRYKSHRFCGFASGTRNKSTRAVAKHFGATRKRMDLQTDYSSWSNESLIERVTQLEKELKSKNDSSFVARPQSPERRPPKKPRTERQFDPSKYSTRLVAFKLAYLGKQFNGYEHHAGNPTPFPTIEEELWKAFNKARLIFPKTPTKNPADPGEVDWDGLDYSKCGRTDKGVSAFGQVIGIRVRSNRPLPKKSPQTLTGEGKLEGRSDIADSSGLSEEPLPEEGAEIDEEPEFDPIRDEIPYCTLLNRLLPPTIRILAWCPNPPADFSARFSCRERQYRYFFTQPAFAPTAHHLEAPPPTATKDNMKDGWLDIPAMRKAANLFEGLHDFRNFCKVDGGKQIENFERRIFKADIEEVSDTTAALGYLNSPSFLPSKVGSGNPKVYTFTLHGSAFLWHQVRCMVSILFLVAQGLEKPELVTELLNVKKTPRRPIYEMATDTPLVLWDCVFPSADNADRKDALEWLYIGSTPGTGDLKYGTDGIMDSLWKTWRERKVDEILAGSLISVVAQQGKPVEELSLGREPKGSRSQKVFDGRDKARLQGVYKPVMKKEKMDSVEVINEKYALRKGFESSKDMKTQGFRRLNGKEPVNEIQETKAESDEGK